MELGLAKSDTTEEKADTMNLSKRRRRNNNGKEEEEKEVRNPTMPDLPADIMVTILSELDLVDILLHAQAVSSSWRKICKDPRVFRTIRLPAHLPDTTRVKLLRVAAKRGHQHVTKISLPSCNEILAKRLVKVCKKLPLLEELEFTDTEVDYADTSTKSLCCTVVSPIGQFCQQLKYLRVFGKDPPEEGQYSYYGDNLVTAIAENMSNLRGLRLYLTNLTDIGLNAILAGCPHLQELDLQDCCFAHAGIQARLLQRGIEDLTLPSGSVRVRVRSGRNKQTARGWTC